MGALRLFLSTLWKRSPSSSSLSPMLGTTALYDVAMVRLTVRTGRSRFQAAVGLFMALLLLGRTTSSKSKRKSCSAATPNLARGPDHFPRGQSRPVASPGPENDLYRPQGPSNHETHRLSLRIASKNRSKGVRLAERKTHVFSLRNSSADRSSSE
jgi:hypothetical protein